MTAPHRDDEMLHTAGGKTQPTAGITRRQAVAMLGASSAAFALGATDSGAPVSPTTVSAATTSGSIGEVCAVTPTETAGPFPSLTDLVRSDVRDGKPGALLTLTIKVVNVDSGCTPVPNANVEIWHCDAAGNYSQYGSERQETYLRGIQTTHADGEVTFTTIYPGWYAGRATHIHLEVILNGRSAKVTQIAFPDNINAMVHGTGVYASRGANPTSNAADGIFADSLSAELVMPVGDPSSGYSGTFQVGI